MMLPLVPRGEAGLFRLDNAPPSPKEPQTETTSIKKKGEQRHFIASWPFPAAEGGRPTASLKGEAGASPGTSVIQA